MLYLPRHEATKFSPDCDEKYSEKTRSVFLQWRLKRARGGADLPLATSLDQYAYTGAIQCTDAGAVSIVCVV